MKTSRSLNRNKLIGIGLIFFVFSSSTFAAGKQKLVASYNFSKENCLSSWIIEGDGKAYIENGKLILEPDFYPLLKTLMDEGKLSKENNQDEYAPYLVDGMTKKYGKQIERYYSKEGGEAKVFRGGCFNFWNKFPVSGDFVIEFEFRSLSPAPLQMFMFCAIGKNGESIFAPNMPARYGLGEEIMFGSMYQYRLSFFHPSRRTANLRRAPGREMVAQGKDLVSDGSDKPHLCRIEHIGDSVRYLVDGAEVLKFQDKDPLPGGHWGFRLMPCAKGEYDNVNVYSIIK